MFKQWRAQDVNIGGWGVHTHRKVRPSKAVRRHVPRKIFEIWVSEMALFPHSDSIFERNPRDIDYVYFHS